MSSNKDGYEHIATHAFLASEEDEIPTLIGTFRFRNGPVLVHNGQVTDAQGNVSTSIEGEATLITGEKFTKTFTFGKG